MARRKLSQRQKERIQAIQERRRNKLAERTEKALEECDAETVNEGLVVARHGNNLAIAADNGGLVHCLTRQNIGHPVCGDRVVWQPTGHEDGVVTALLPRSSVLSRPDYSGRDKPIAANINQLVIILAPEPEPTGYLLDQYLVAAETIGVSAVIGLNKMDTLEGEREQEFLDRFALYQRIGYPIIPVSAKRDHGLDLLVDTLKDHTNILVGQSGVGKSSLINALLPDLDLQEGKLSSATGQGRHTTSAATWYRLPAGGAIIDSPGVRSFRLGKIDFAGLEYGYRELRPLTGTCRFANCRHDREPGCAVKASLETGEIAPQRLDNFIHMAARLNTEPTGT